MAAVVSDPVSVSDSASVRNSSISSFRARSARSIAVSFSAFLSEGLILISSTSQMTRGTSLRATATCSIELPFSRAAPMSAPCCNRYSRRTTSPVLAAANIAEVEVSRCASRSDAGTISEQCGQRKAWRWQRSSWSPRFAVGTTSPQLPQMSSPGPHILTVPLSFCPPAGPALPLLLLPAQLVAVFVTSRRGAPQPATAGPREMFLARSFFNRLLCFMSMSSRTFSFFFIAICSGLSSIALVAAVSALWSRSSFVTSTFPLRTATCSSRSERWFMASWSPPWSRNVLSTSIPPSAAAAKAESTLRTASKCVCFSPAGMTC
mmetsp:Transcript_35222/g.56910  ORF Transcript_35222/g.56910 Transcript_35222/m.56910 type:complete len:320 (-) Transcript_35222:176-1135(-)